MFANLYEFKVLWSCAVISMRKLVRLLVNGSLTEEKCVCHGRFKAAIPWCLEVPIITSQDPANEQSQRDKPAIAAIAMTRGLLYQPR